MKTKAELCKDEGNKSLKDGKLTEAILHYTEGIKYDPNSAVLHSNRSLAFLKMEQLYLALEDALQAIKLEPSWAKGFYRKGEIEQKAGHYTKALMSYKQAQLLDPTDEGIVAAISRTNKEYAKDKKDAARRPIMYTCIGVAIGMAIISIDHFIAANPIIKYAVLQVLILTACGGLGYGFAQIYRYFVVSQRESMLEEPLDILKEIEKDGHHETTKTTPVSTSHKGQGQAAGRQKTKKGKS